MTVKEFENYAKDLAYTPRKVYEYQSEFIKAGLKWQNDIHKLQVVTGLSENEIVGKVRASIHSAEYLIEFYSKFGRWPEEI